MNDPYNLKRFVDAQAGVYAEALGELRRGRKTGHWMWFIFPQLRGLGRSSTAFYFGIDSLAEAKAYLAHGVLGARLVECTRLVNSLEGRSGKEIFGPVDDLKFRSCLTLFSVAAAGDIAVFGEGLDKYFAGASDSVSLQLLGSG